MQRYFLWFYLARAEAVEKIGQEQGLKTLSVGELLEIVDYIIKRERDCLYSEFPTLKEQFERVIDEGGRVERMGTLMVISKILYNRFLRMVDEDEED